MRHAHALLLGVMLAAVACEDPARPAPDIGGATVFVASDPQGGRILVDGEDTGLLTPALVDDLVEGAHNVGVELDSAGFTYAFTDIAFVSPQLTDVIVEGPLTIRCTNPQCLRAAAEFHASGNIRFAVNAAGPLFVYDAVDVGIVWPTSTLNSYSPIGTATMTALVDGTAVTLGVRNAGTIQNYWAGRPIPTVESIEPYRVVVPAWLAPPVPTTDIVPRGLEVMQEVIVDEALPDVIQIRVTWTNISADSLYRLLDPGSPAGGVSYTDVWLGFILDADIGAIGESDDDLASYSAERGLVYAYDSDLEVTGFSGGWSDRPGLIGLMVLDGPGLSRRMNAWPRARDFVAGATDENGRLLLTALQNDPPNHPDTRIGFAPNDESADYLISVAAGPVHLPPGASISARFAVLLAPPAAGTYTSGVLLPAGDPAHGARPLAATAAPLLELADDVIGAPEPLSTP